MPSPPTVPRDAIRVNGCVISVVGILGIAMIAWLVSVFVSWAESSATSATSATPAGYATSGLTVRQAQDAVRAQLRDPQSAVFSKLREKNGVTCGAVNARNGFGGMAGDRPFVVTGQRALIVRAGNVAENDEWMQLCAELMRLP